MAGRSFVRELARCRQVIARATPAVQARNFRAASPSLLNYSTTPQTHGTHLDGRSIDPSEVAKFAAVADKWSACCLFLRLDDAYYFM